MDIVSCRRHEKDAAPVTATKRIILLYCSWDEDELGYRATQRPKWRVLWWASFRTGARLRNVHTF
jgi:hypothetical protein